MKDLLNIKYWLFDLDNTLYSGDTKVFDQVDKRMSKYISSKLNVSIEEAKKIKETAESDIAQSTNKAKETLKEELSVLVVTGASKILNKEIDEGANKEIVDQLIKEL
mgnify:CR=1 FL=1